MKVKQKPVIVDAWKFDISNIDEIIAMYERIFNVKVKSMLEVTTLMQGVTNTIEINKGLTPLLLN